MRVTTTELNVFDQALLTHNTDHRASGEHIDWLDERQRSREMRRRRDEAFIKQRLEALRRLRERYAGDDSQDQTPKKAS